jgi:1-acyl-sn-glycerol-3-phosphate acyltransferase
MEMSEIKPTRDWMRPLRYLLRTPLLLLHLLIALPLALLVINPLGARLRVRGERLDHATIRAWSRGLVRLFGLRVRIVGQPAPEAALFVANHHSWLDIEVLHACRMMHFVAKAEIARWPLVGWLASRAGTIFHARGSGHSLASVIDRVSAKLRQGHAAGVFPEGSTGPSDRVRTFHARIFQTAIDAGVPVQPVALRYGRDGEADHALPFLVGESFVANFFRVLGGPTQEAEVHFLQPLIPNGSGRRDLAERSRAAIAQALGVALARR